MQVRASSLWVIIKISIDARYVRVIVKPGGHLCRLWVKHSHALTAHIRAVWVFVDVGGGGGGGASNTGCLVDIVALSRQDSRTFDIVRTKLIFDRSQEAVVFLSLEAHVDVFIVIVVRWGLVASMLIFEYAVHVDFFVQLVVVVVVVVVVCRKAAVDLVSLLLMLLLRLIWNRRFEFIGIDVELLELGQVEARLEQHLLHGTSCRSHIELCRADQVRRPGANQLVQVQELYEFAAKLLVLTKANK